MFDTLEIRKDFPILGRMVNGVPLVYLDNAATSQKPASVIKALVDYYELHNANVHRGAHTLAMEATIAYEEAREKVARFINAPSPENIVFVRNTTEAINLVAYSWARGHVGPGDRIVSTEMEHHSNLVPWQQVVEVRRCGAAPDGTWAGLHARPVGSRRTAYAEHEARRADPYVERPRHDHAGTRDHGHRSPDGRSCARGRRAERPHTCRWTCRRSVAISSRSQDTRWPDPRASACCTSPRR